MEKYTKEEAVKVLDVAQAKMAEAKTKEEAIEILSLLLVGMMKEWEVALRESIISN